MLDASLIVLPEVEQALMSAMHDIKRFCLDLQSYDNNTPKRLNKSLLYKAHHHIQLCENNLHGSGILLPNVYLPSILNCLEILQENNDIEVGKFTYILKAIQSLLEYISHSLSIGIQEKNQRKYIGYLYYPYNKLLNEFGLDTIISLERFINVDSLIGFDIDVNTAYYAKYDIFLLKQLKEYIVNIKDNWHDVKLTLEYAHKSIDIILNIEWHEILSLMQCIEEYLTNQQNNADLELASALLFMEYIINEPWRVHEIITKTTTYNLKQIIQTLVEQIYSPNAESAININDIHQKVQAYSIRKSVLYQIDILIKEAQDYINSDCTKSSEVIQQIHNILQTIGFSDKSNLLCKLQQKLSSIGSSKISDQDINYINYIFGSLSQYIQNNYPEDIIEEENIGNDIDEFDNSFEDNFAELNVKIIEDDTDINFDEISENNSDDSKHDQELWSVFKDEQLDLLLQIQKHRDELLEDLENKNAILSLRRCFHTFKSSFKILELGYQAKASANIEQIFNKYISQKDIDIDVSILLKLVDLSLVALLNLDDELNKYIEEINSICDSYLIKERSAFNVSNLTQNKIESVSSVNLDNKAIFKQNLLFIYMHEVEEILHSIEHPLQQRNARDFLKILHKIEGSSSTANCIAMQEWCQFIRKTVSRYRVSNKIPDDIATLVQYAIYLACDIPKNLTIDNVSESLNSESQGFLSQIVEKSLEDIDNQDSNVSSENLDEIERNLELDIDINFIKNSSSDNINLKPVEQIIDNTGMSNLNIADIELVSLFIEEAQTLHTTINQNIDKLYIDNNSTKEILRALHTLKGGARMVGIDNLGEQYHLLEDDVAQNISSEIIQQKLLNLLQQIDYIAQQTMLNQSNINRKFNNINNIELIFSTNNITTSDNKNTAPVNSSSLPNSSALPPKNANYDNIEKSSYVKVDNKKLGEFIEKSYHVEGYIAKINTKIRDLISQTQSTFMPLQQMSNLLSKITLQEHRKVETTLSNSRNTDTIQNSMDSLELDIFSNLQIQLNQGQNVNNSIIAQQEYILECLGNISELINSLLKYHSSDIQHELIHLSLLSFTQITAKLHQTCQQVAREEKKIVKLEISGESIRVSKTILEGVSFAFEHLIRNAIKHGIEDPETRKQNNKNECGKININIQQQGEYMHINFRDDGQGIDIKAVRRRAIQNNWLSEYDEVCLEQLISFILQPGFSTAQDLSQTAGRGIGLDAVVAYIREIGGEVSVVTHVNLGFSISIIFPLQSFVSDILVCKVGDYSFGTLLNNITKVSLNKSSSDEDEDKLVLETQEYRDKIKYDKRHHISMLDLFNRKIEHPRQHKKYIELNTNNDNYHLGLDETILYKSMYIRKSLIPYKNEGLVGISIINFTEILPIYNLEVLVKCYHKNYMYDSDIDTLDYNHLDSIDNSKSAFDIADEEIGHEQDEIVYNDVTTIVNNISYEDNNRHIMVVDDSSTLRFTTQRILKKYNYEVTLAIDGIEAIEKIEDMQNNNRQIDLFLVDIEMPRMDGFELIAAIRSNPIHITTPIIVISSRQIEKYQQQVYDLGANDFLGKPYQTAQLMSHITRELTKANITRKYT